MALSKLGYTPAQIKDIIGYIDEHETIEGAPHLKDKDLPVFDCAFKPTRGVRSIHYMGHIKMMGAVQPFISGAISKTVNVPKSATVEDIEQAYIDSWRIGAKAVSIYRDGSKRTQPLNTSKAAIQRAGVLEGATAAPEALAQPRRHKLPDERTSITHKFDIAGHEGYITVGLYEDGQPGELFLTMAKEGSTISGFADAFAQAISYALQYGVPLQDLVDKFSHVRFEPAGMTKNPDVRFAKSIVDYIFRWMAGKFLSQEAKYAAGLNIPEPVTPEQLVLDVKSMAPKTSEDVKVEAAVVSNAKKSAFSSMQNQEDAPPCTTCGSIMVRSGACYKCPNCGTTSGCA
jgi:ribonucleoside-diphosphate reductase alpha chain